MIICLFWSVYSRNWQTICPVKRVITESSIAAAVRTLSDREHVSVLP
jgi:hypothetical protein